MAYTSSVKVIKNNGSEEGQYHSYNIPTLNGYYVKVIVVDARSFKNER